MYSNMIDRYGKKQGKAIFYAKLNKHGLKDTEPMPAHLDKEFVEDLFESVISLPDELDDDSGEEPVPLTGYEGYQKWYSEISRSITWWNQRNPGRRPNMTYQGDT
jgi:hypothetical protein